MFDTAAIAAKSSGWSPIRPRMSRSARTRSRAVPVARRRGMPRSYAAPGPAPAHPAERPAAIGRVLSRNRRPSAVVRAAPDSAASAVVQVAMDQVDGDGALTDGRGHALDRAVPDV